MFSSVKLCALCGEGFVPCQIGRHAGRETKRLRGIRGPNLLSRKNGIALMLGVAAGIAVLMLRLPPLPQSASYHHFADQRGWLGIPNFWNVVSNVPFAVVGISGLAFIRHNAQSDVPRQTFIDPRERWPYIGIFAGLVLTAFGSAYYHWATNNAHLVWDRLPMTIVFGSMVAALVVERIGVEVGLKLLPIFVLIGAGSVLQWYWDELHGHGDMRLYAAIQIYSALALLLAMLLRPRYSGASAFVAVFGFYVLAKIFEETDRPIYAHGHVISGHTLKHVAVAAAGYWILRMLQQRVPCPAEFIAR